MRSIVGGLLVLVMITASSSGAAQAAGGHNEQPPREEVALVREVDRTQKRLVLGNGIEVWATDARQLEQVEPGTKVRIRIEMSGGRRLIYSIERLPQ